MNAPGIGIVLLLVATVLFTAPMLAAAETADALRRDWLFQAQGEPLGGRIRKEIERSRVLAESRRLAAELDELAKLQQRLAAGDPDEGLYLAVRAVKRRILLGNPAIEPQSAHRAGRQRHAPRREGRPREPPESDRLGRRVGAVSRAGGDPRDSRP